MFCTFDILYSVLGFSTVLDICVYAHICVFSFSLQKACREALEAKERAERAENQLLGNDLLSFIYRFYMGNSLLAMYGEKYLPKTFTEKLYEIFNLPAEKKQHFDSS